MTTVYLVNKSARLTLAQLAVIAAALAWQDEKQFSPAYGMTPANVQAVADESDVPAGAPAIAFVDTIDTPGALGYHVDNGGFASGLVDVPLILDNGGTLWDGANSVSVTAGHEFVEMKIDPATNRWRENGAGQLQIEEPGDPVENDAGNGASIADPGNPGGYVSVALTNFVLPAYWDPANTEGPFDYLHNLKAPFTMTEGGYVSLMSDLDDVKQIQAKHAPGAQVAFFRPEQGGPVTGHVVFGASYPAWKIGHKLRNGRAAKSLRKLS